MDASAAHEIEGTGRRDQRLSLMSADLSFDQFSKASLQSLWTNQMSATMPPFPAHGSVGPKGATDKKKTREIDRCFESMGLSNGLGTQKSR